jgi:hypothetical protein
MAQLRLHKAWWQRRPHKAWWQRRLHKAWWQRGLHKARRQWRAPATSFWGSLFANVHPFPGGAPSDTYDARGLRRLRQAANTCETEGPSWCNTGQPFHLAPNRALGTKRVMMFFHVGTPTVHAFIYGQCVQTYGCSFSAQLCPSTPSAPCPAQLVEQQQCLNHHIIMC